MIERLNPSCKYKQTYYFVYSYLFECTILKPIIRLVMQMRKQSNEFCGNRLTVELGSL